MSGQMLSLELDNEERPGFSYGLSSVDKFTVSVGSYGSHQFINSSIRSWESSHGSDDGTALSVDDLRTITPKVVLDHLITVEICGITNDICHNE